MNVKIESSLIQTSTMDVAEFNYLISILNVVKTFDELKRFLDTKQFSFFRIGFGSSHAWVKQYNSNGILHHERILLITL